MTVKHPKEDDMSKLETLRELRRLAEREGFRIRKVANPRDLPADADVNEHHLQLIDPSTGALVLIFGQDTTPQLLEDLLRADQRARREQ